MKQRRVSFSFAFALSLLAGVAAYAGGVVIGGPPQGSGGGGASSGVSNPMTEDLDAGGNRITGVGRFTANNGDGEIDLGASALNLYGVDSVSLGVGGSEKIGVTASTVTVDADVSLASGKAITNALYVVKVRRAAAQTMTDGGNTDISWDTEQLDTGGVSTVGAGASTTVLTTGASGEVYYVTANVGLVSAASVPSISIKLIDTDGTTPVQRGVLWFPSGATSTIFQATAVIVSTAANQTIRVHFGHDSTASINTSESISGDVSCTAVRVR